MGDLDSSGITVVFFDDNRDYAEALPLVLSDPAIELVAVCPTPAECLEVVARARPNVAIIDLWYGSERAPAGIELIRQIRAVSPATACGAFTAYGTGPDLVVEVLRAGAHGFWYRGSEAWGFDAARRMIKSLAAGAWDFDPETTKVAEALLGHGPQPVSPPSSSRRRKPGRPRAEGHGGLSRRHLEVLQWAAEGKTNIEIAKLLGIAEVTVRTYWQQIFERLEVQSRERAVLLSIFKGYLNPPVPM